jgi:hypothetical protein
MAKVNAPLYALNQGEVSKMALGRVDVAKMRLAAECQLNWMPWVIGPMMLRPGLIKVGEVYQDLAAKLVKFVFAKTDTAGLELTPNVMCVRVNDALVTRDAVATVVGDSNFTGTGAWATTGTTSGASVVIATGVCTLQCLPIGGLAQIQQTIAVAVGDYGKEHGVRIVVTNGPVTLRAGSSMGLSDLIAQTTLDTGTHSLACTPSSSINLQISSTDGRKKTLSSVSIDNPSSGSPVTLTLPTPWGAGDLANIRSAQSGDVIYIACYGQQQYKIERRSTNGWSTVLYRSSDGPFQQSPALLANFTPSVYDGNGTLTSDQPYFKLSHVGALFRLFSNGQANQAVLGNQNAFSAPVRVSGVGTANRNYNWTATGTWAGTLTLQRSFDGPTSGFTDVSTISSNGTLASSTGGSSGTPDLDNAICWERIGFKAGAYTSGSATVVSGYAGGGGYGICRVTGFNNATSVNIEVLQAFSSLTATTDWVESDWSGYVGWPTSVSFVEGRLGWYGRDEAWLSTSDNYSGFAEIDSQGNSVGDAGPINETMGDGPVDTISWGLPLTRLLLGREQSIASVRSSSFDEPLTATNISIKDCATQGAMRLPAIKIDKRGIFVQQSNRRVYDLKMSAQEMDYTASDLTRLNLDIGKPGFVSIDAARQPDTAIGFVRADGVLAQMLYEPEDDVVCWWRAQTLGVIEDVMVLPGSGIEDNWYFVVRRVINGVTRRFYEKLAYRDQCVGGGLNYQLDCAVVYAGAPTGSIELPHLPNTLCVVWADGVAIGSGTTDGAGNLTMPDGLEHSNIVAGLGGEIVSATNTSLVDSLAVPTIYNGYPAEVFADLGGTGKLVNAGTIVAAAGAITLPNGRTAHTMIACFGYVAPFMSAKLAYGAVGGSALNQKKKIDHLGVILYDTHYQGLKYGQRFDALDDMPLIEGGKETAAGTVWSELEQPVCELPGEWDTDARVCLLAQAPNPCMVGSVVVGMDTSEKT